MYFAVGKGWLPIVQEAVDKLVAMGATIDQVKEKFGGLRIYYHGLNDSEKYKIGDAIVENAELACSAICDQCGKPGTLRSNNGWLCVRCDEHA